MNISLDELEAFITSQYKKSCNMRYQHANIDYVVDGWNDSLDEIMWWIDEKRDAKEKQSTEN